MQRPAGTALADALRWQALVCQEAQISFTSQRQRRASRLHEDHLCAQFNVSASLWIDDVQPLLLAGSAARELHGQWGTCLRSCSGRRGAGAELTFFSHSDFLAGCGIHNAQAALLWLFLQAARSSIISYLDLI